MARVLGLANTRPLTSELVDSGRIKLVTFVPGESVDTVLDALATAGAGVIGNYERCSFRVQGTGTFRPKASANPYAGSIGEDAVQDELRIEMEVPKGNVSEVVAALLEAHPYEEVAYDLLPRLASPEVGFGIVGSLAEPTPLADVAHRVRELLPAPHMRYAGDPRQAITTVACVGGAGDGLIAAAQASGADVYITGDLRHHVALNALEQGLALIDAGHHATEAAAIPAWIDRLQADASMQGLRAPVVASSISTGPWRQA